jgi:hypothetical protein
MSAFSPEINEPNFCAKPLTWPCRESPLNEDILCALQVESQHLPLSLTFPARPVLGLEVSMDDGKKTRLYKVSEPSLALDHQLIYKRTSVQERLQETRNPGQLDAETMEIRIDCAIELSPSPSDSDVGLNHSPR